MRAATTTRKGAHGHASSRSTHSRPLYMLCCYAPRKRRAQNFSTAMVRPQLEWSTATHSSNSSYEGIGHRDRTARVVTTIWCNALWQNPIRTDIANPHTAVPPPPVAPCNVLLTSAVRSDNSGGRKVAMPNQSVSTPKGVVVTVQPNTVPTTAHCGTYSYYCFSRNPK